MFEIACSIVFRCGLRGHGAKRNEATGGTSNDLLCVAPLLLSRTIPWQQNQLQAELNKRRQQVADDDDESEDSDSWSEDD
jgi:hypothetical protein